MLSGRFAGTKKSRAFENNIYAQLTPRQLGRVTLSQNFQTIAVNIQVITVYGYRAIELAMSGIVLSQVRIGLRIAEIVDSDNIEFLSPIQLCLLYTSPSPRDRG